MERMMEKAREELEMLENQHPHRFDYLKLELKSFISLLQSQQLPLDPLPTTSTATTQASTSMKRRSLGSMKRRKVESEEVIRWEMNEKETKNERKKMRMRKKGQKERDRVDVVLEKAEACLRKIQDFKFSLVC